jgi:hypothetical protein
LDGRPVIGLTGHAAGSSGKSAFGQAFGKSAAHLRTTPILILTLRHFTGRRERKRKETWYPAREVRLAALTAEIRCRHAWRAISILQGPGFFRRRRKSCANKSQQF